MTPTRRTGRPRGPAIRNVVAGTYAGTEEIVTALVRESTHLEAWRPVRAAAMAALIGEEVNAVHLWMTTAEFSAWLDVHFPPRKKGAKDGLMRELGMTTRRRAAILGGAPITKVEALACAHYATGRAMPVPPRDTEAFSGWVEAQFGATKAICKTLNLGKDYIADRVRGYDSTAHGRMERLPEPDLIRAMDWCLHVGPFSPYGPRIPARAFPSQKEVS